MFTTAHIHPMLVHFPIALALLGCLLEAYDYFFRKDKPHKNCGEIILYFATVSAFLAAFAGGLFTPDLKGEPGKLEGIHQLFATLTIIALSIASASYLLIYKLPAREELLRKIGLGFYIMGAILVGVTGFLGGTIVYDYLIGV